MILGLQWNLFVYRRIQNGRNLKMDSMVRKLKYLAQSTKCTLYLAAGENITIKMSHVLCVWYIADLLWRCFQVRTLKCTEKTPIYIIQGIKNYSLAFFFRVIITVGHVMKFNTVKRGLMINLITYRLYYLTPPINITEVRLISYIYIILFKNCATPCSEKKPIRDDVKHTEFKQLANNE